MADAPPALLERLGTAVDPLVPKRSWPAESTIRRLLARIDADALDQAVGAWLADRPSPPGRSGNRTRVSPWGVRPHAS
ncbi:transposase family protein [Streptomyces decoyicus]